MAQPCKIRVQGATPAEESLQKADRRIPYDLAGATTVLGPSSTNPDFFVLTTP
jgi:hypothetical protein